MGELEVIGWLQQFVQGCEDGNRDSDDAAQADNYLIAHLAHFVAQVFDVTLGGQVSIVFALFYGVDQSLGLAVIKASGPKLGEENMAIESCAGHRSFALC